MQRAVAVIHNHKRVGATLLHTSIHSAATGQTVSSICLATLTERDRRLNEERSAANVQAIAQQLANSPSALAVRDAQAAAARSGSTKPIITCTFCSKTGHEERNCWDKQGKPPRNARRGNANLATQPAAVAPDNGYHVYTALSTTPAASVWYLDSGASNHYCREARLVDSVQPCAKLSTVEAEYMATAAAAKEAIWWRSFFGGLGHDTSRSTVLHSDSQGSIALAHNPDHHARTKHIDIRYHFIRQHVADKTIALSFVRTQAMAADIFTKPLEYVAYERGVRMLGLSESSSRGGVVEAS